MKKDVVIREDFLLPSRGLVYKDEFDPHVTITSMTTAHEMKRLSHSEYPYMNLAEIIDDCILTETPISAYDMCVGDFQFLLYMMRVVTYGGEYRLLSRCPHCGSENQFTINIEDMEVKEYTDEVEEMKILTLPRTEQEVILRFQTPHSMDIVADRTKEFKRRTKGTQPDATLVYTVMSAIDKIEGKSMDEIAMEQWVRNLPMADVNAILKTSEKLNDSIGVETNLKHTCDTCGLGYNAPFRTTQEFFRPDIW